MSPDAPLHAYVTAVKTVQLVCGGLLTFLAVRAARGRDSTSLRTLAIGLGLVTAGPALAGVVHQFTPIGFDVSVAVESTFTAAGIGVVAYSLYRAPGERVPVLAGPGAGPHRD